MADGLLIKEVDRILEGYGRLLALASVNGYQSNKVKATAEALYKEVNTVLSDYKNRQIGGNNVYLNKLGKIKDPLYRIWHGEMR